MGTGAFARTPRRTRAAAFGPCLLTFGHRLPAGRCAGGGRRRHRRGRRPGPALCRRRPPGHVQGRRRAGSLPHVPGWVAPTGRRLEQEHRHRGASGRSRGRRRHRGMGRLPRCRGGGHGRGVLRWRHDGTPLVPLAAWLAVTTQDRWVWRRLGSFRVGTTLAFPVPLFRLRRRLRPLAGAAARDGQGLVEAAAGCPGRGDAALDDVPLMELSWAGALDGRHPRPALRPVDPTLLAAVLVVYGCSINVPFIAIQRYNRICVGQGVGAVERLPRRRRHRAAPAGRGTTGRSMPYGSPP